MYSLLIKLPTNDPFFLLHRFSIYQEVLSETTQGNLMALTVAAFYRIYLLRFVLQTA